ncbi:protein CDV3 homolog [Agrilus planipennis]|uniref:Protein CDV3 homolog n=1 Tax=Agrilus planipennis TaxID=224129 RepID=A0A1W4WJ70_AGRPL|nr:protein CDV3 homolog [Agrilus planipennis]
MADLDDFFAKKDRKKSKGKKFTTTEEVAKKLEDTSKKTDKPTKKERPQEGEEAGAPVGDQDEWKEFEEEKKDYSGLKIGNLTINSQEGSSGNSENTSEQRPGEEGGGEFERRTGPWKQISAQHAEQEEKKEKKPEPVSQPTPTSTPGAYVPPSMRNQPPQQTLQTSRLKSKTAPDIHNEDFFPSLSSTKTDRKIRNEGSFEVVSHNKSSSIRQAEQSKISSSQGPKLNLGNRYNTLSNDS